MNEQTNERMNQPTDQDDVHRGLHGFPHLGLVVFNISINDLNPRHIKHIYYTSKHNKSGKIINVIDHRRKIQYDLARLKTGPRCTGISQNPVYEFNMSTGLWEPPILRVIVKETGKCCILPHHSAFSQKFQRLFGGKSSFLVASPHPFSSFYGI